MIKIDSNITLPRAMRALQYPITDLQPGQSFFVPDKNCSNMSGVIRRGRLKVGGTYCTRQVTEDGVAGVRVFRLT